MAYSIQDAPEHAGGPYRPALGAMVSEPRGWNEMVNCWQAPRTDGVVTHLPGYDTLKEATESLRGLIYAKSSSGEKMLLAVGATKLTRVSLAEATYGNLSDLATGLTYGQEIGYIVYNDAIYIFNGSTPKKITIESSPTVSTPGLTRPDTDTWVSEGGLSASVGGNGVVRGVVQYFISEVASGDEGALSTAFATIDTGEQPDQIDIVFDPTALTTPANMENKDFRIYRTFADGVSPFYVGTIEVATISKTFTDNVADVDLGNPPLYKGDPPPTATVQTAVHLERGWYADGSDLYYTDVGEVESCFVSANGYLIEVKKNDGDDITALGSTEEGLVIWKRNHMYILLGKIEEEFYLERITSESQQARNIGTPSQNSVAAVPGGFVFYWKRAVYTYFGGQVRRISEQIESKLTKNIDRYEDQVHVGFDSFSGRAWVSVPTEAQVADRTFFFSFRQEQWVGSMDRGFKGFQYIDDFNTNLVQIAIGSGYINEDDRIYNLHQEGVGYDGDGFDLFLERSVYDPGRGSRSRFMYIDPDFAPEEGNAANVTMETMIDGNPDWTSSRTFDWSVSGLYRRLKVYIDRWGRYLTLRYRAGINGDTFTIGDGTDVLVDENGNNIGGAFFRGFKLLGQTFGVQRTPSRTD